MTRHIVMFRLEGDPARCSDAALKFKNAIEALPAQLPELKRVEVGINDGSAAGNWNIVLTADCLNEADLAAYSAAPAHIACVAIIKPLMAARACVDYSLM